MLVNLLGSMGDIFGGFHNEYDIHMSSENDEANGYGHDLELAIISTNCTLHNLWKVGK